MAEDVLPPTKFDYTHVPIEERINLMGDPEHGSRMSRLDKSRMQTIPPSSEHAGGKPIDGPDKRSAMDIEVERLQAADQPIESTFSPLDIIGPGMAMRAARSVPTLVGALSRSMRREPTMAKPEPAYQPMQGPGAEYGRNGINDMPVALRMDIEANRAFPQQLQGYVDKYGTSRQSLADQFANRGYTRADIDRILDAQAQARPTGLR